jgi:hypothetical protein
VAHHYKYEKAGNTIQEREMQSVAAPDIAPMRGQQFCDWEAKVEIYNY